jgi:hypothetical protein
MHLLAVSEISQLAGVPQTAANRAEPLNLRFERAPTLNIWRSDTGMLHSPDTPYGRTCHRCTCHPHEQPWGETQGLKHNRGIELCLSFLNLFGLSCMQDHSASKASCAPLRRALEFPDSHFILLSHIHVHATFFGLFRSVWGAALGS